MRRPVPLAAEPAPTPTPEPPVLAPADPAGGDQWPDRDPRRGAPSELPGDEPRAAGDPAGEGATGDEGAGRVGIRDVWAAARARRKVLRAEVRRFTVRQRRRRILWIAVAGAVLALILGTLGIAYSPLFAVERVRVVGTVSLDPAAVESALADQLGTPLARVDSSAVKAALVQFPLVESYTLEARPPHELVVRIVERTPIGSVSSDAGYTLVDAAGVALSTTPEPAAGYPVVTASGGIGSPAFAAIGTVYRALPAEIRSQVTAMSAQTPNDVTLTLGATGTEVVWGNADDSAYKAVVLAKAMAARPPTEVFSYDVSSPAAVVIR